MKIWQNYLFNLLSLILLSCSLIWITDHYILTSDFFTRNGQYLSGIPEQELTVYNLIQKWIYISAVAYLLVRIMTVSVVLYTALYLSEVSVSFEKILRQAILAEFLFLLPAIIKIWWFYNHTGYSLVDWDRFYALSVLSFIGDVPAEWHYALQTLNIFEVLYWFLLASGIRKISSLNYDESLKIVIRSYLPAVMVWVLLLTFFTLVYFPSNS